MTIGQFEAINPILPWFVNGKPVEGTDREAAIEGAKEMHFNDPTSRDAGRSSLVTALRIATGFPAATAMSSKDETLSAEIPRRSPVGRQTARTATAD
jgi:hypothetical protein